MAKICIDAGHGGRDCGAIGPTGLTEAFAALKISSWVSLGLVESGHEVFSTRTSDEFVELQDRCRIANIGRADLFLSIHCNAFSNPAAHGTEFWTSVGQTRADDIAEELYHSVGDAFQLLLPRVDTTDGDSDKEAGFAVLVGTTMPAVLIETAFITNATEERWLRDPGWRMKMAGAIVCGVNRGL